jgi:hypothetical protein
MTWKPLQLLAATAFLAVSLPAATLTLTPATISGAPGTTTGWSYSLDNDTANWIVINSVVDSGFNPAFGTFTEYAASNFNVVAPGTIFSETFNLSLLQGFGQFDIAPGATIGDFSIGSFLVGFDTYSSDPLVDGGIGFISGLGTFDISFARVDAVDPVPEPATLALTGAALLAVLSFRRRN